LLLNNVFKDIFEKFDDSAVVTNLKVDCKKLKTIKYLDLSCFSTTLGHKKFLNRDEFVDQVLELFLTYVLGEYHLGLRMNCLNPLEDSLWPATFGDNPVMGVCIF